MSLTGLGSVRIVKNCDLRLENTALGLQPRTEFSRPRSQFFTIQSSQPANNIYNIVVLLDLSAAFDKVDHVILLKRLSSKFGLNGSTLG